MSYIGRVPTAVPLAVSDIPDLPTSKITSGTFADARIAASNVSQHATSFDDNDIVNDLSTLGLRVHTQENLNASNSNSASFDVFQDSSGVTNLSSTLRDSQEFVSCRSAGQTNTTAYRYYRFDYTVPSNNGYPKVYEIFFYPNASGGGSEISKSGATLTQVVGSQYSSSNGTAAALDGNTGTVFWHQTGTANLSYKVDFGSGVTQTVKSIKYHWQQHASVTNIKVYGSNDDSEYTQVMDQDGDESGGGFLEGPGGGSLSPAYEFNDATVVNASGSFEGVAITASSTSSMGAVITYQDTIGTNTLNTDIILKLSANNGSNYSTATLTALPDFATGIKMAKVNDLSVTAGTQLKYKIEFANQASGSKEASIRGVSLQY